MCPTIPSNNLCEIARSGGGPAPFGLRLIEGGRGRPAGPNRSPAGIR